MIGSVIGGLVAKGGSDAAAGAIGAAAAQAQQEAINQRRENRSDLSPWMAAGTSALSQIGKLLGWGDLYNPGETGSVYNYTGDPTGAKKAGAFNDFYTSPGYQFRRDEGIKALDRSASAKGRLMSGAQMKGVQNFGDGLASDEYGTYTNTLMNLAGLGQAGTGQLVNANTSISNTNATNQLQGGIARGSAYERGANALASGIGQGINNVMAGAYMFGGGGAKNPAAGTGGVGSNYRLGWF